MFIILSNYGIMKAPLLPCHILSYFLEPPPPRRRVLQYVNESLSKDATWQSAKDIRAEGLWSGQISYSFRHWNDHWPSMVSRLFI